MIVIQEVFANSEREYAKFFGSSFRAMRGTQLDKKAAARDGPSSTVHRVCRTYVHVEVISEVHIESGGDEPTPPEIAKAPANHGLTQMRAGNEFPIHGTPARKSHVVQGIRLGREVRCVKALNLKRRVSALHPQETRG